MESLACHFRCSSLSDVKEGNHRFSNVRQYFSILTIEQMKAVSDKQDRAYFATTTMFLTAVQLV